MEEREEEELIQPVFSTSYYTDDHLAEAPRREKMSIEGSDTGKPRHRHRGGRRRSAPRPEGPAFQPQPPKKQGSPRPPKQQSRPEGQRDQREDRPAGENKRRRPPYRGGRRWNKNGDAPKT